MGKAIMYGSHIGKSTARIADGKAGSRRTFEKEQAGVLFFRVRRLLLVGVDVVKYNIALLGVFPEVVGDLHGHLCVDVGIPGQ